MGDRTCQYETEQDDMSIVVKWEAFRMFRYHTEVSVAGNEAVEFGWDKIISLRDLWGSMTFKKLRYRNHNKIVKQF